MNNSLNDFVGRGRPDLPICVHIEFDRVGLNLLPNLLRKFYGEVSVCRDLHVEDLCWYASICIEDRNSVALVVWLPNVIAMAELLTASHTRLLEYWGLPN